MTKDSDFVDLVCRLGTPPQIIWLTLGIISIGYLFNALLA